MTTTADLSDWARRFEVISAEHQRLRADGMWKSGSRTLLQAVGLQHHETSLCDALVWALTPDGWHGVGVRPLRGFLARVGVPPDALDDETLLEAELTPGVQETTESLTQRERTSSFGCREWRGLYSSRPRSKQVNNHSKQNAWSDSGPLRIPSWST